jgi:hypothetical protein
MEVYKPNMTAKEDRWKSRAIILRCSDETYDMLVAWIDNLPDCYLVFSKSSNLKLMVKEEGF